MSTKRLFCGTMFYASIVFEIFAYKYDFFCAACSIHPEIQQRYLYAERSFTPAGGAALPQQHRAADRAVHSGKPGRDHHPYHPGSGAALLLLPFQRGAHLPGDRLSGLQGAAPRPDAGACHPWGKRQPPGKGHHPAGQPAGDRGQGDPQEHPEPAGHPAAAFAG